MTPATNFIRPSLALAFFLLGIGTMRAVPYGTNLLVNGNAESGPASSTGAALTITGWSPNGPATVVPYGVTAGFPTVDQGPIDDDGEPTGESHFFAGGNDDHVAVAQKIEVSANAGDIDAGEVACDVSGWLGGFLNQEDNAIFIVSFRAADDSELGTALIGPVTAAERNNKTLLLFTANSVFVPPKTRSIDAVIFMQRVGTGTFNDGYADNLSVVLRGPATVSNTADSGPGSLRAAVTTGAVIRFDPQVFNAVTGPHTINLGPMLPKIQTANIIGPGAKLVTIRPSAPGSFFPLLTISSSHPLGFRGIYDSPALVTPPVVTISGVTLSDTQYKDTQYQYFTPALLVRHGTATLNDCVLANNLGGALIDEGSTVVLNRCSLFGNSTPISNGAAISVFGDLYGPASLNISNCTISGNTNTDGSPGVISIDTAEVTATVSVSSSTITKNSGAFDLTGQSGGSNNSGTITIDNTIVAGNGAAQFITDQDPNFPAPLQYISKGFNLSSNNDVAVLNQSTDRNNTSPMLGPLQDNGGPTPTCALLPGSLAIDKGNTTLTVDQRGFPRPVDDPTSANGGGNNSDIGAFETNSAPASPTPTPSSTPTATSTASPTATATPTASPTATATPTASPTGTAPPGGTSLANISTRLPVQTGDNALIGGFIITGTQPKKVIIRAIGPSLSLPGKLANPVLQLFSGNTLLESNDNWVSSANKQAIIDSTIPPTSDLESAIVRTLPANGATYTAIVRGVNNTTGIGVVEAYDLDRTVDSKLANISTRGFVQTGDNVLIAGTIILGSQSQKVIVRAIGPSLPFAGALADPTLELRDQNGAVLEANDNWVDSPNKQAIIDSTIPPTSSFESAIVRTLPGNGASYTAIVRGVNDTTGIAVVEVYSLQ